MLAREIERLDPIAGADGVVTVRFEKIVEELHIELVVLHDQDGLRHSPRPFFPKAVPTRAGGIATIRAIGHDQENSVVPIHYGKANPVAENARNHAG